MIRLLLATLLLAETRGLITVEVFSARYNSSRWSALVSEAHEHLRTNFKLVGSRQGRMLRSVRPQEVELCPLYCVTIPDCHFIRVYAMHSEGFVCELFSELGNTTEIVSPAVNCPVENHLLEIQQKIQLLNNNLMLQKQI